MGEEHQVARDRLRALVERHYDSLRAIAERAFRREGADHTLSPTALLHEAFVGLEAELPTGRSDTLFLRACFARKCRNILVDFARRRNALRRGGHLRATTLSTAVHLEIPDNTTMLAIDEAIERLHDVDARMAELVELRLFGELKMAECAIVLDVSERTASKWWTFARDFLKRQLR